ncbi:MAG: CynX/NimT family MFS transporter [Candidatus Binataceae bacterium]
MPWLRLTAPSREPTPASRGNLLIQIPWLRLLLLWLAGIDVRLTLLAIPPLIPLIHRNPGLSETGVAALTGLPILLTAAAATIGSIAVSRYDARRTVICGIILIGVSSGLRGVGPSLAMLFGMTFLMGAGIAAVQPALPSLVYHWAPGHIGLATAVYTNGQFFAEIIATALTTQIIVPMTGSWPRALGFWAIFPILTALMLWAFAPPVGKVERTGVAQWWPDFFDSQTWRLGLMQGGSSMIFFGANAFFPDFLHAAGASKLISPTLAWLSAGQLPASVMVALLSRRLMGRRGPVQFSALISAAGVGIFFIPHPWARYTGAFMLGFSTSFSYVLTLVFPPLLARESGEVHRISAGMFTIGYGIAFIFPLIAGAAWDRSGIPAVSLFPLALGAFFQLLAPIGLRAAGHRLEETPNKAYEKP